MPQYTNQTKRVLVVGPEIGVQAENSSTGNYFIEGAANGWDALERVQSGLLPDLVVLDSWAVEFETLHTLRWLRRLQPEIAIVLLAREENFHLRREAIRAGAQDFVVSAKAEDCWNLVVREYLSETDCFSRELHDAEMEQVGEDLFFIAASTVMGKLRAQIASLAEVNAPVLIVGEQGSGKELAARLIHKLSVRSGSPFLKVSCADLPGDLLHRELFGDASPRNGQTALGKFELSKYGTLFLDGIVNLPAGIQANLLEKLQASFEGPVRVRLLAACESTIGAAVADRSFRQDLYYRLSVFTLNVPSLRERRQEIPILLTCFLNQLAKRYGLPAPIVTERLREVCQNYNWPGNLRELEIFAKRYLVTGDQNLAIEELQESTRHPLQGLHQGTAALRQLHGDDMDFEDRTSGLKWLVQNATGATEKNAIATALARTQWNRKAAARLLKVSYRTLLYKIERYRLSPPIGPLGANGSSNGLKAKPAS